MSNINVRLEDISKTIEEIKDSSTEKEKEDKIKGFEGNLKQDNTMLNEYPKIKFEFVAMLYKIINLVYTGNTNHKDKHHLDAIVDKIFPDEEMRGGKKPKKTRKTKKARKARKARKTKKAKKSKKTRKARKTRNTKKRIKRGGVDEPDAPFLTLSMLNTSNDSSIGKTAIGKTDIEESRANDELFGDLSMISIDEQDGPNELDITNTTMEPLTLSMLNTSQNNTSQKNSVLDETDNESFGGKRTTRRAKKSNKKFRKTRSKKQRRGDSDAQEEKDKYLFDAIDIYDYDKVENALNNGANVNAQNKDGDTPLIRAIKLEDIDMVYLLLERPDIDIELDVDTNKELQLAEELTPEDEEQNGIPYAIEDYIITKKEKKRIQNIVAQTIPKHLERQKDRKELAARLSKKGVGSFGDGRMPLELRHEIGKYLGGGKRKRRTKRRGKN